MCFSSLQVSDKSLTCSKCPHSAACVEGAYVLLDRFRGTTVVEQERRRLARIGEALKKTSPPVAVIEGARAPSPKTKRAPARASRAEKQDGSIALAGRDLARGRNPGKKGWEQVLFDLLLGGSLTRKALVRAFMEDGRTNFTYGTARTRCSTALTLFQDTLLLREQDDGHITLHPRFRDEDQISHNNVL
ncbi:hypothetical protein ATN89_17245 [Comamonas thiooxydans]|nr:hypothetical protein ATN89_17245 [Comamonas thiooxydans]